MTLIQQIEMCFVNKHQHVRIGDTCTCELGTKETIAEVLKVFRTYIKEKKNGFLGADAFEAALLDGLEVIKDVGKFNNGTSQ